MPHRTLDNEEASSQSSRLPVYNALELMLVLFNFLLMFYTLTKIKAIYVALGFGFAVPVAIGVSICSAPILVVKKWRKASLLYDRKKSTTLLFRMDTDNPNRHITLIGGAIWAVVGLGILAGALSGMLLPKLHNKLLFRFLLSVPFLLLGFGQIIYIISSNRILTALKTESKDPQ